MVKGAQATANQDGAEPDRGNQRQRHADTGTLPMLRLPTLSILILPFSSRTRTPMASFFATPESFKDSAAVSAVTSLLKIAKTTVLFDMNIPFLA